ncbi:hypothetical protein vBSenS3_121 [Salmonella phage vB_SenS-3]|uniref:Uncharacterized protein n=3 Tax=Caudoviricetes TaxID=2731619 RepID=A0AAE9CFB9_9CAUD|nr:hypothetical protein vBSenS3_121 [Salmonella phage vB_SenS-3]UGO55791.1 hypothetical protein JLBYU43_104 [Escherichia phage JLBYU43]
MEIILIYFSADVASVKIKQDVVGSTNTTSKINAQV